MHQQVKYCNNCTLCPHCIYVFCVCLRANSDLCHLQRKLVFITEIKSVYSAVRTGSLDEAVCASATYSINWLVFITEMKSVYSAVQTGSLNQAVCACATYSTNWLVFITEMKSVYTFHLSYKIFRQRNLWTFEKGNIAVYAHIMLLILTLV
jgi:hypothetical protein